MQVTDQDIYQGVLMITILKDLDNLGFKKSIRFQTGTSKDILNDLCKECFVAFVCGTDGIALISYDELKQLLDDNFEESERIGIKRKPKGNYWLKGRDGKLEKSVTNAELGVKIYKNL